MSARRGRERFEQLHVGSYLAQRKRVHARGSLQHHSDDRVETHRGGYSFPKSSWEAVGTFDAPSWKYTGTQENTVSWRYLGAQPPSKARARHSTHPKQFGIFHKRLVLPYTYDEILLGMRKMSRPYGMGFRPGWRLTLRSFSDVTLLMWRVPMQRSARHQPENSLHFAKGITWTTTCQSVDWTYEAQCFFKEPWTSTWKGKSYRKAFFG